MGTRAANLLPKVLFSKTRRGVFTLFFGSPNKSFYANEIIRAVDTGTGSVQRELEKLTKAGILKVTKTGNQKFYQINRESPVYKELRAIVSKTLFKNKKKRSR